MSEPAPEVQVRSGREARRSIAQTGPGRGERARGAAGGTVVNIISEGTRKAGESPVIPLLMTGLGAYLMWYGVHYWRSSNTRWPSDPIKLVLQGKGLPPNVPAGSAEAAVTAYETGLAAAQPKPPPAGSVPGGEPPVPKPSGPGQQAWITAFLASVGAPPTPANLSSVAAWINHESPWNASPPDGALYTNNPLNTTEPGFGSTGTVNAVGVRIYPSVAEGLAATQAVITNGRYGDILLYLRSGRGLCGLSLSGLSTWSGGGYSQVC